QRALPPRRSSDLAGNSRQAARPGLAQEQVDRPRAQREQAVHVAFGPVAAGQPGVGGGELPAGGGGPVGVAGYAGASPVHQAGRAHAGGSWPSASVSTSTPSSVTATMCSHCAESLRSLVTTVQPSGSTRV